MVIRKDAKRLLLTHLQRMLRRKEAKIMGGVVALWSNVIAFINVKPVEKAAAGQHFLTKKLRIFRHTNSRPESVSLCRETVLIRWCGPVFID